jgi:ActR/RegA family two-component response regulator
MDLKCCDGFGASRNLRGFRGVMLTGSFEPCEASKAYCLGATSFLVKPLTRAKTDELARSLDLPEREYVTGKLPNTMSVTALDCASRHRGWAEQENARDRRSG